FLLIKTNPPHHLKSTLIHRTPGHAHVDERSDHRLAHSSGWNARPQLGNASLQKFTVQPTLGRLPRRTRTCRIDPRDGLHHWRAVESEEELFHGCDPCVPPDVQ